METYEILKKLNENSKECIIKNRRKGPDFLLQFINLMGLIIWVALITVFAICEKAKIELFNFDQTKSVISNLELLNVAIIIAACMFFVSAFVLLISLKRTRRRSDKIKISLLLSETISFVIGILLLIKLY